MAGFEWDKAAQERLCNKTERPTLEAVRCSDCRFLKGEGASMEYPYPTLWCSETGYDLTDDDIDLDLSCPVFEELPIIHKEE